MFDGRYEEKEGDEDARVGRSDAYRGWVVEGGGRAGKGDVVNVGGGGENGDK